MFSNLYSSITILNKRKHKNNSRQIMFNVTLHKKLASIIYLYVYPSVLRLFKKMFGHRGSPTFSQISPDPISTMEGWNRMQILWTFPKYVLGPL